MSFSVRYSLPLWLAAACLLAGSGAGLARDSYRRPAEMEPLHHDNDHEIIFEMEPLHPVKRAASQPAQPTIQIEQPSRIEQATKPAPAKAAKRLPKNSPAVAVSAPAEASKIQPKTEAAAPKSEAPAKPLDVAKPGEAGHMAVTPPAVATTEPSATEPAPVPTDAAAPVADATQPTPLPLDQALHPADSATTAKSADPATEKPAIATNEPTAAVEAPAQEPAQPAPVADKPAEAQQAEAPAPTAAEPPAAAPIDTAAQITALLAKGTTGPAEIHLGDRATMFLPAGRVFVTDDAARDLAKAAGFDWRPTMRGLIAPTGDKLEWLAPVELLEDGYIKSDVALDADKLLGAFSAGLPEVNAQRVKAGQPSVELSGWLTPPAIDEKHRLSACVNVTTQGADDKYFNCEAWALGRDGAVKISLAEGGENGERLKNEARQLAETVVFDHGKLYEEVDLAADKVAPYAVAELLTSDVSAKSLPTVAPTESGMSLLDWLGMLAAVGAVAAAAWIFLRRRQSGADEPDAKSMDDSAPSSAVGNFFASLRERFSAKKDVVTREPKAATESTGGLMDKFSELRGRIAPETAPAEPSAPVIDADAASALQKLASRMRRSSVAEPVEAVDVSRAMRAARPLPGAAPEAVEPRAPAAATVQPAPKPAPQPRETVRQPEIEESFGLVEPGDTEATTHAQEALRQANG